VVIGAYRDLFAAVAASAATLTGLLFVAVSVVPRRNGVTSLHVIQQVRAAAALLAFTNALAISLFGLVPGTNAGYPAAVLGIIGILFTAAGARSILSSQSTRRQQTQQLELFILLMAIFGAELVAGIAVIADPRRSTPVQVISYAVVSSLLVGIARAWELVGDRETGIRASIAVLAGRTPGPVRAPSPEPADAPESGTAGQASAPAHELDADRHRRVPGRARTFYQPPLVLRSDSDGQDPLAAGQLRSRLVPARYDRARAARSRRRGRRRSGPHRRGQDAAPPRYLRPHAGTPDPGGLFEAGEVQGRRAFPAGP
jgi:hypothetical protein